MHQVKDINYKVYLQRRDNGDAFGGVGLEGTSKVLPTLLFSYLVVVEIEQGSII